jgi:uncharacterized membrane protein
MISLNIKFSQVFIVIFLLVLIIFLFKKLKIKKLFYLRLLLIFLFILMLLDISYKRPKNFEKIKLDFLVDNSYSMKFNNRLEKVKDFIKKNYDKIKKYDVRLFLFNEDIEEFKDEIDKIKFTNKATKINYAIEKLLSLKEKPNIVLLFSDGINYTSELPDFKKDNIFLIPICFEEKNFKDVSIANIKFSRIGFKDVEHFITADVVSYGYNDVFSKIQIIDFNTKEVMSEKKFLIKEGSNEVKISFIPKNIGRNRYILKLQNFKDEITDENNYLYFDVEVKKNKIRVLYICGQPSAEYFHLRNLLKNEPSIDLVSFVILRNPDSIAIVPDEDLSLIPFPVYDIFVKELFNYDLLILENFPYYKFGVNNLYLENVKKFVLSGGGFIMIGGQNSFFLGGYKWTPIEEILPIMLSEKEKFVYTEYKPQVVDYKNKFIRIFDDEKLNKELWENIPELGNYQKTLAKDDAKVILKYQDSPIMCYFTKSKGRVFVSLTNTTWRWSLGNLISKKYNYRDLYAKFWKNVIYWCSGAEEMKNINIICSDNYNVGDEVEITIISNLDENIYTKPQCYIILPNGNKTLLSVTKIQQGKYRCKFTPTTYGRYKINVFATKDKETITEEKEILVSQSSFKEIAILKPNIEYMSELAKISDQELAFINGLNLEDLVNKVKNGFKKEFVYNFEICNNPFFILFFIFLFLLEIYIARVKR